MRVNNCMMAYLERYLKRMMNEIFSFKLTGLAYQNKTKWLEDIEDTKYKKSIKVQFA